jgi:hypothetical protein
MRPVLVLGLLITLCASANAATVHRSKPATVHHLRTRQHVIVRPSEGVTPGFAVPGWTDEQTRQWLLPDRPAAGG